MSDGRDWVLGPGTKIPVGWVAGGLAMLAAATLFLADIKTRAVLNSAKSDELDKRLTALEGDLKVELRLIRSEIKALGDQRQQTKRGPR